MFHDEARFGRIVDMRRCWCPKPWRPVCRTIVSRQYTYAYAAAPYQFHSVPMPAEGLLKVEAQSSVYKLPSKLHSLLFKKTLMS
jgi:hypothetical protein